MKPTKRLTENRPKIALNKETVRALSTAGMTRVVGGARSIEVDDTGGSGGISGGSCGCSLGCSIGC